MVNVPTDHAVKAAALGLLGHRHFKIADEIHRLFDLELQVSGQRPVFHAQAGAQAVEVAVDAQSQLVHPVTDIGQPFRVLHHPVKMVTVNDPELHPGGRGVRGLVHHVHPPKCMADKMPGKLIVVARHINHAAAFAGPTQEFLNHVVVALRPKPTATQLPTVHNVTHQVQSVTGVVFQKIQQGLGLKAGSADVQIRNKNRPHARATGRHVVVFLQ